MEGPGVVMMSAGAGHSGVIAAGRSRSGSGDLPCTLVGGARQQMHRIRSKSRCRQRHLSHLLGVTWLLVSS